MSRKKPFILGRKAFAKISAVERVRVPVNTKASPSKRKRAVAAQIIFLHGASSSGKSTIARALQARIEKPFWHISIDHLRDAGVLPLERFCKGDFEWTDARAAFFDGFHASHCSLPLLISREAERSDRAPGSAKRDFETIPAGRRYDLELNSEDGPEANVDILLKAWRSGPRSSDFSSQS